MDIENGSNGAEPWNTAPETMSSRRWLRIWAHRPLLLRVARGLAGCAEDGEDAVHEAMLRAAEHPEINEERLQPWLITVTRRLCVDEYRHHARESRRWERVRTLAAVPEPEQRIEEEVCERAAACWVASRAAALPSRQAAALQLTAAGRDVQGVANQLGVSYRTAESLLARARRTLRAGLTAALGLLAWTWRGPTGTASGSVPAAAAAVVAATAAVVIPVVLTPGSQPHSSHPQPPAASAPSTAGGTPAGELAPRHGSPGPTARDRARVTTRPVAGASSAPLEGPPDPLAPLGDAGVVVPPAAPELPPLLAPPPPPALPDAEGTTLATSDRTHELDDAPPPAGVPEATTAAPEPAHPLGRDSVADLPGLTP